MGQTSDTLRRWMADEAVHAACERAGWPHEESSLLRFLDELLASVERRAWQQDVLDDASESTYGHPVDVLTDWLSELRVAAPGRANALIRRLWLVGFEPDVIAEMADLPTTMVVEVAARYSNRDIVQAHLDGRTPIEIAEMLGVSRGRVYQVLADVQVAPNSLRARVPEEDRDRMVDLYRDGSSLQVIADSMGYARSTVKGALRTAHRRGDLPEWGTGWQVVSP